MAEPVLLNASDISASVKPFLNKNDLFISTGLLITLTFVRNLTAVTIFNVKVFITVDLYVS